MYKKKNKNINKQYKNNVLFVLYIKKKKKNIFSRQDFTLLFI